MNCSHYTQFVSKHAPSLVHKKHGLQILFLKYHKLKSSQFYFFKRRGPTLSPVALLCFTWLPSQSGKVPDLQHLHPSTQKDQIFGIWTWKQHQTQTTDRKLKTFHLTVDFLDKLYFETLTFNHIRKVFVVVVVVAITLLL